MYLLAEQPFTINGVKSWIRCIDYSDRESGDCDKIAPRGYHYHEYIEFLYALDCDVNVWINGVHHRMLTGDLIIFNSGEQHCISFNRASRYICVQFSPSVLCFDDNSFFEFKYVTPFLSDGKQQKLFSRDELNGLDVHSLSLEIMKEWNEKKPAYELKIRANILNIFSEILRRWNDQEELSSKTLMTEQIKNALVYIGENYDSVTEKAAAEFCGLSYTHFSQCFKKAVGRSFRDYILLLRLREAEKLLVSTEKSITDIAFICGFASTSHFIARFKAQKGVTPGQIRKKCNAER